MFFFPAKILQVFFLRNISVLIHLKAISRECLQSILVSNSCKLLTCLCDVSSYNRLTENIMLCFAPDSDMLGCSDYKSQPDMMYTEADYFSQDFRWLSLVLYSVSFFSCTPDVGGSPTKLERSGSIPGRGLFFFFCFAFFSLNSVACKNGTNPHVNIHFCSVNQMCGGLWLLSWRQVDLLCHGFSSGQSKI